MLVQAGGFGCKKHAKAHLVGSSGILGRVWVSDPPLDCSPRLIWLLLRMQCIYQNNAILSHIPLFHPYVVNVMQELWRLDFDQV